MPSTASPPSLIFNPRKRKGVKMDERDEDVGDYTIFYSEPSSLNLLTGYFTGELPNGGQSRTCHDKNKQIIN